MPWQQLAELRSLRLKGVALPAAAAAYVPPFAALTALTSLRLSCYNLQSYTFAQQLRLLTGLRSLKLFPRGNLNDDGMVMISALAAEGFREALAGVLLQLVQLQSLSLRLTGLDGTALAAVSRLTQLQQLHLTDECRDLGYAGVAGDAGHVPLHIQHLPSSLTQLKLQNSGVSCSGNGPNSCGQQLQQLRELNLCSAGGFQLDAVAYMTCLTHVAIRDEIHNENFTRLLDGLSHLQQLQRVHVEAVYMEVLLPPAASYAALTASSQLTALLLSDCCMHSDAARHMFAAGRQLPHLQQLEIAPCDRALQNFSREHIGLGLMNAVDELKGCSLVLQPSYAAQLVACCPNLRSLSLLWAPPLLDAASSQPLTLLTQLTSLESGVTAGTIKQPLTCYRA